jgi:hypothetical protein
MNRENVRVWLAMGCFVVLSGVATWTIFFVG